MYLQIYLVCVYFFNFSKMSVCCPLVNMCHDHTNHLSVPFGETSNLTTSNSAFAKSLREDEVKSVAVSSIPFPEEGKENCCEFYGTCTLKFLSIIDKYNIKVSDMSGNEFIILENAVLSFNDEDDEKEHEEWEPEADDHYYGDIPSDVTFDQLVVIMVNGLYNFVQDARLHGWTSEQIGNADKICDGLLDLWLEHDSLGENKFDHLVDEDMIETFTSQVQEGLIAKDPTLA